MDHNLILARLATALHDDPELSTRLEGWYGRLPLIFMGIDSRQRPAEAQCPAIEMDIVGGQAGGEEDDSGIAVTTCYLSLVLTLHDDGEAAVALPRITEKSGITRRDTFRKLVTRITDETMDEMEIYLAAVEHINNETDEFPFWQVTLAIALTEQVPLGMNPVTA